MNEMKTFLDHASDLLQKDERIIALCAAGSWITNDIDIFSDLDLVVETSEIFINIR
jgi:predicted nucleotidyltransferase